MRLEREFDLNCLVFLVERSLSGSDFASGLSILKN